MCRHHSDLALRPQVFVSPSLPNAAALFTLHSWEGAATAWTGVDKSEIEADTSYITTNLSSQAPGAQPTLCAASTCMQGQPQANSSLTQQASAACLSPHLAQLWKHAPCLHLWLPWDTMLSAPQNTAVKLLSHMEVRTCGMQGEMLTEPCFREPLAQRCLIQWCLTQWHLTEMKYCGLHGHEPKTSQRYTQAHHRHPDRGFALKAVTQAAKRMWTGAIPRYLGMGRNLAEALDFDPALRGLIRRQCLPCHFSASSTLSMAWNDWHAGAQR